MRKNPNFKETEHLKKYGKNRKRKGHSVSKKKSKKKKNKKKHRLEGESVFHKKISYKSSDEEEKKQNIQTI